MFRRLANPQALLRHTSCMRRQRHNAVAELFTVDAQNHKTWLHVAVEVADGNQAIYLNKEDSKIFVNGNPETLQHDNMSFTIQSLIYRHDTLTTTPLCFAPSILSHLRNRMTRGDLSSGRVPHTAYLFELPIHLSIPRTMFRNALRPRPMMFTKPLVGSRQMFSSTARLARDDGLHYIWKDQFHKVIVEVPEFKSAEDAVLSVARIRMQEPDDEKKLNHFRFSAMVFWEIASIEPGSPCLIALARKAKGIRFESRRPIRQVGAGLY
ncbi:hypothetical protein K458DRAFT_408599 [Lentithecium fluviatile CBS 122367]|uniref:Uncharacterized protein n=1 Tax=Lentithecium fluviatile CBS 122367 TaxID=1168545 RepID=A0A6G1IM06_9PLEO|nr:hypothetical protein K458DRAFT_408599 [Lentithecium fluviatile CBS 122367]